MFHAYGAYVVKLREEFGWSKTLLSAAFAMARAESGIFGPLQGWMTDRFGPRVLIRTGMGIFGIGFILFSFVGGPVTFFLTFFVMAVGSSLGGYMPIGVAIVSWFRKRRALALSISSCGMSAGGILVQLVALALTSWGWRWTAFASGMLILALGIPLAQVVRHRPEPYGFVPDGLPVDAPPDAPKRPAERVVNFTAGQAIRTRAFWMISAGHGAALLVVSAVMVHLIVHVTERLGYSLQQAATVLAVLTVVQLVAQLSGGWAGDRFSKRLICVGCMIAHAAGLLILAHATAFWMLLAFALIHGAAWGIRGPLMSAIRADYFGAASFGMISGISSMVLMIGMMGGPLVAGILADRTGSYVPGFHILAALAALGSLAFVAATPPRPPERPPVTAPADVR
jgi:MFS family permease